MLVGTIHKGEDGLLYNAMALLDGGKVAGVTLKHELPNYGTFDEKRVFAPRSLPGRLNTRGVRICLPICEDMWFPHVPHCLTEPGAKILFVPTGTPFAIATDDIRLSLVVTRVSETGLPLVDLNRVGGQDEIVFDGSSFVLNADRSLALQMQDWEEAVILTHWRREGNGWVCEPGDKHPLDPRPADIYRAMMVGLHDSVTRSDERRVVKEGVSTCSSRW